MKLTYYRGNEPNFGDELNTFLWDRLLPADFLDDDETELFLGAGSIIWNNLPGQATKYIAGSGYGGYTAAPDVHDGTWNVGWVRGPLSTAALGLDPAQAITDAAVLLRAIELPEPASGVGPAFMPHFQSIARGNWQAACEEANVTFLDPRGDPMHLISQIRGASVVIAEAMHGAIVADAMRTPFVAVTPAHPSHRFKWQDWALSVGLMLRPVPVISSSVLELYMARTGKPGRSQRSRMLLANQYLGPVQSRLIARAAARLREIVASVEPQLSRDSVISVLTDRSREALDGIVRRRAK